MRHPIRSAAGLCRPEADPRSTRYHGDPRVLTRKTSPEEIVVRVAEKGNVNQNITVVSVEERTR